MNCFVNYTLQIYINGKAQSLLMYCFVNYTPKLDARNDNKMILRFFCTGSAFSARIESHIWIQSIAWLHLSFRNSPYKVSQYTASHPDHTLTDRLSQAHNNHPHDGATSTFLHYLGGAKIKIRILRMGGHEHIVILRQETSTLQVRL